MKLFMRCSVYSERKNGPGTLKGPAPEVGLPALQPAEKPIDAVRLDSEPARSPCKSQAFGPRGIDSPLNLYPLVNLYPLIGLARQCNYCNLLGCNSHTGAGKHNLS